MEEVPAVEKETSSEEPFRWSIADGELTAESLVDYPAELKSIAERSGLSEWSSRGRGDVVNRIIVADIVELAVRTCNPELFDDDDSEHIKTIQKDIGSSAFASCSYSTEKMDEVAKAVSDLPVDQIPALKALDIMLMKSPIFLADGKDIGAVCRTAVLHILAKQSGRDSHLPKAGYNDD